MLKQNNSAFSGRIRHFIVVLRMIASNASLQITVEDTQKFQNFRTVVDRQFIAGQGGLFKEVFTEPQDIYHFITENFEEVKLEDMGLTFTFGTLNKVPRKACIPLCRQEVDEVKLAHLKIDRIEEAIKGNKSRRFTSSHICIIAVVLLLAISFAYCLQQSQRQIIELIQKNQELKSNQRELIQNYTLLFSHQQQDWKKFQRQLQNQDQRQALLLQQQEKEKTKIGLHAKDLQQKWKEIQHQFAALSQKSEELATNQRYQKGNSTLLVNQQINLSERLVNQEKHVQKLEGRMKQLEEKNVARFDHHPYNPHKTYFFMHSASPSSARLRKTANTNYNFVNYQPILPQIREMSYTVKILRLKSTIVIGFTTEKGLGVADSYQTVESVYYDTIKNGQLWVEGKMRQLTSAQASEGDTIEATVNFLTQSLSWRRNGAKIAECKIPNSIKDKPIYLSIISSNSNDQVELFA